MWRVTYDLWEMFKHISQTYGPFDSDFCESWIIKTSDALFEAGILFSTISVDYRRTGDVDPYSGERALTGATLIVICKEVESVKTELAKSVFHHYTRTVHHRREA